MSAAADAFMGIFGFKRVEGGMEKLIEELRNHAAARTGYTTALIGKAADALESQAREIERIIENLGNALNAESGPTFMGEPVISHDVPVERSAMQRLFRACGCSGAVDNTQLANLAANKLEAKPASGGDELAALRYTSDGALAECPCCGSLDVGGAQDTVNCYGCGLQITKPRPLQNAADAWNKRAAQTCRPDHSEDVRQMVAADGWQLVPVGPTAAMWDAGNAAHQSPVCIYSAMLAAAPTPSKQGGAV